MSNETDIPHAFAYKASEGALEGMFQKLLPGPLVFVPDELTQRHITHISELKAERDAARAELAVAREIIDRDTAIIAAQAADIVLLRMALAKVEPVKSAPASNPFRSFLGAPRRIGG